MQEHGGKCQCNARPDGWYTVESLIVAIQRWRISESASTPDELLAAHVGATAIAVDLFDSALQQQLSDLLNLIDRLDNQADRWVAFVHGLAAATDPTIAYLALSEAMREHHLVVCTGHDDPETLTTDEFFTLLDSPSDVASEWLSMNLVEVVVA